MESDFRNVARRRQGRHPLLPQAYYSCPAALCAFSLLNDMPLPLPFIARMNEMCLRQFHHYQSLSPSRGRSKTYGVDISPSHTTPPECSGATIAGEGRRASSLRPEQDWLCSMPLSKSTAPSLMAAFARMLMRMNKFPYMYLNFLEAALHFPTFGLVPYCRSLVYANYLCCARIYVFPVQFSSWPSKSPCLFYHSPIWAKATAAHRSNHQRIIRPPLPVLTHLWTTICLCNTIGQNIAFAVRHGTHSVSSSC